MDLHTISFLFGAVLVAVAILGGGFEVKEIKVPKVGRFARLVSAIAGIFFVAVGIRDLFPIESAPINPNPLVSTPNSNTAPIYEEKMYFSVSAYLGKVEDAEELKTVLRLFIDGVVVADFLLDSDEPSQSTSVKVSEAGQYRYLIEGYTEWNITGSRRIPLRGSGVIEVQPGAAFTIEAASPPTTTMQSWDVELTPE